MNTSIKFVSLVAALAATLANAQAAVITWGNATPLSSFTSPSEAAVYTAGSLFAARKFGGSTDYTVGGVNFAHNETKITLDTSWYQGTYTKIR
jgi:hypothetical protein